MADQTQSVEAGTQSSSSESFYSGALRRIGMFMAVSGVLLFALAWWKFGLRAAVGFALGCLIAFVNFYWLKRVIAGFVERATGMEGAQPGGGIVFRFLLRYALLALGAYAILTVSPASLKGLLAGLFLPVAAIICEAAYEVYAAVVRGV
jgi:hypothetical protein